MEEQARKMKYAGIKMSILMGVTLSFFLSLTGILSAGRFTIPGWLISFFVSTLISLVISVLVPMKKVSDAIAKMFKLNPRSLLAHCLDSLVSDIIYTPIITFCMVFLAYRVAVSHGAPLHFLPMFLHSLLICMIVGYVLIFIFMPLYKKLAFRGLIPPKPQGATSSE